MNAAVKYGAMMALAVFLVGWITGMGGSFLPNVIFSVIIGVFAGVCYVVATRIGGRGRQ